MADIAPPMIGAARSANAPGPGTRHVIPAGIIGNVLEWYDFSVYGYVAAILGLRAFVQLSVVIGYYRMIAGLASGFEFPLPARMSDPFNVPGRFD